MSICDFYYMMKYMLGDINENIFEDQVEFDLIIEDFEVILGVFCEEFYFFVLKCGLVVGLMMFVDVGDMIDLVCMGFGGWLVLGIVELDIIQFKKYSVKFILFVEKEVVWVCFNEDKFWKCYNCFLVMGQG